jgi:predicted Zn-dependent peptidase
MTTSVAEVAGAHRTRLPNGLVICSEFVPGVRSIALGVWVRSASLHERPEQMGIAHLLEHLVFKGTRTRSAKEIALALESRGGALDAYTGREHTCFQAHVLDRDLAIAAELLRDLTFHPLLREEDLELERHVIYDEIASVDDTPDDLVFEKHNTLLWGDHPYGHTILGRRETLEPLTADDVRAVHRSEYRPDNIVIGAAGNVVHEDLVTTLVDAGWGEPLKATPRQRASVLPRARGPLIEHEDRESQQSHIVFGSTTIPMSDRTRPAFLVVSALFGGGMSSRLFQRVREEMGLAYSVYGYQTLYADVGVHGVYVGTAPDTAARARAAVTDELKRLADHGIPEDELTLGRRQLVGQFLLSQESVGARMNRAAGRELYGEPYRTIDEVIARIEAVTVDDALAIAQTWFAPDRQTVLTLGPRV